MACGGVAGWSTSSPPSAKLSAGASSCPAARRDYTHEGERLPNHLSIYLSIYLLLINQSINQSSTQGVLGLWEYVSPALGERDCQLFQELRTQDVQEQVLSHTTPSHTTPSHTTHSHYEHPLTTYSHYEHPLTTHSHYEHPLTTHSHYEHPLTITNVNLSSAVVCVPVGKREEKDCSSNQESKGGGRGYGGRHSK